MKTMIYNQSISSKLLLHIFILLFVFQTTGCKKDKFTLSPISVEEDYKCISVPSLPCNQVIIGGIYYIIDFENYVSEPCFNPNNDNEFVYTKRAQGRELRIYNLQTKENKLILASNNAIRVPKWGETGWIVFESPDCNVYKIKSDGDSLVQMTTEGCYNHPSWFFDEDKIITYNRILGKEVIIDINGNILDTLIEHVTGYHSTITRRPYLLSNGGDLGGVSLFNFQTGNYDFRYYYQQDDTSEFIPVTRGSTFWLNNLQVIYSNYRGLHKLNISSSSNINFKKSCNARVYKWGDINSSKTKMIWARGDYTQIDSCTLGYQHRIYLMDIDGSNEQEIDLR